MRICLDTCIIIDAFLNKRPFSDYAREIFIRAARGNGNYRAGSRTVTVKVKVK